MKQVNLIVLLLLSTIAGNAQPGASFPEKRIFNNACARFAIDEKPNIPADSNLIAIWKMKEDVDEHNYFVMERYDRYNFLFTYMNKGGSNRTYEHVRVFFSNIGNTEFLNLQYEDRDKIGYCFLKVTDHDSRGWDMTLSLVTDTTLKNITSREALRERLTKNINNPGYYAKPVHFHKKLPLMYCK